MSGTSAIVGAGEGLGAALAARFARQGFDLALIGRTDAGTGAAQAAALAARAATRITRRAADATDPHSLERTLAALEDDVGPIEVLIYNVRDTFTRCAPLDMTYEALEAVFRLEVVGALAAARAILPAMCGRGRGTILFSSATAALRGSEAHPLYAIGKFGLRALCQSLARAHGRDGVHIVHVRLDCNLDVPVMREIHGDRYDPADFADPEDVAETYWLTHCQPRGAWSNEIEIRPCTEPWTI